MRLAVCLARCLAALVVAGLASGCERDFSAVPAASDLVFSADTLSFDTVYAGIVPPTRRFTLRNVGKGDVTIGRIRLLGGDASSFGVNIGGRPAVEAEGVRLAHGDSLYVFVNVRRPVAGEGVASRRIADKVVAEGGGNVWSVALEAVVMNVCRKGGVVGRDEEWLCDSIPYLVGDTMTVARGARLTVGPGVSVLMRGGAVVDVLGALSVAGEPSRRSGFRPLRSDGFYSDIPGQWGGMRVRPGGEVSLAHADVVSPVEGVRVDSAAVFVADGLCLRSVSHAGIAARWADVSIANSLLLDCGGAVVSAEGGRLSMLHVTVSNHFSWDARRSPSLSFALADSVSDADFEVVSSIVVGSLADEVGTLPARGVSIRNSLLRVPRSKVEAAGGVFAGCVAASDAGFANRAAGDYRLSARSGGVDLADREAAERAPLDFEGVSRVGADSIQAGAFQTVVK